MGSLVDSVWGKRKEKPPTARWTPSESPRRAPERAPREYAPERAPRGRGFDAAKSAGQAYRGSKKVYAGSKRVGEQVYRGGSRVASFAKKTFTGAKGKITKAFTKKPRVVSVKRKSAFTLEEFKAKREFEKEYGKGE